jgi:hypothetical protein
LNQNIYKKGGQSVAFFVFAMMDWKTLRDFCFAYLIVQVSLQHSKDGEPCTTIDFMLISGLR